jgi:hypothetical protein
LAIEASLTNLLDASVAIFEGEIGEASHRPEVIVPSVVMEVDPAKELRSVISVIV